MVNHKCEIVNYKTKERQTMPKEQFIIVPNTHQPLVSREDFEQVQMLIKSRPSPSTFEVENIFRGIIYCSECGYHLSMAHKRSGTAYYRCMHHYRHPDECLYTHAVHYEDLYETVLERIQSTAKMLQDDEVFYALVEKRAGADTSSKQLAESKDKLKKRHNELSRLLRKLFEDHAVGLIQDENYALFSSEYQSEQGEILQKLNVLVMLPSLITKFVVVALSVKPNRFAIIIYLYLFFCIRRIINNFR